MKVWRSWDTYWWWGELDFFKISDVLAINKFGDRFWYSVWEIMLRKTRFWRRVFLCKTKLGHVKKKWRTFSIAPQVHRLVSMILCLNKSDFNWEKSRSIRLRLISDLLSTGDLQHKVLWGIFQWSWSLFLKVPSLKTPRFNSGGSLFQSRIPIWKKLE